MIVGVVCAMDKELELLVNGLHDVKEQSNGVFHARTPNGNEIILSKSGIGKVNAALCAKMLIDLGATSMISVGVAGSISSLVAGDIVIGNAYCYHDVWCGEPNKPGQVQSLPAVFPSSFGDWLTELNRCSNVTIGTIATGDWFVQTSSKADEIKQFLPTSYNIVAVDMESAALAHVCYQENIPFISIRVISDNPYEEGSQQEQYDDFWDDLSLKTFSVISKLLQL